MKFIFNRLTKKDVEEIEQEIEKYPENFTEWFKIILKEYKQHL